MGSFLFIAQFSIKPTVCENPTRSAGSEILKLASLAQHPLVSHSDI